MVRLESEQQEVLRQCQLNKMEKEKQEEKIEEKQKQEEKEKIVETPKQEEKIEEKGKKERGKEKISKQKKTEAKVFGKNLPISTKHAIYICKFIKGKKLEDAIKALEQVIKKRQAVPFKGEVAHRKGRRMMSGKYPEKASKQFIKLLKSLIANVNMNSLDLETTKISEASANKAPQQLHRFGRTQFKRTHVLIKAKEEKK